MSARSPIVAIFCFLAFANLLSADQLDSTEGSAAPIGTFRNTYYYVILESNYAHHARDTTILTLDDQILATVSRTFKKALTIEGTGLLLDGRVVNFSGRKAGENRYRVTQNSYGDGVGHCALVPYHTIAVDPRRIPLGSVVQIDETIGMQLPDGTIHNGIWRAEDVGSAIKGDRIDLFMGGATERSAGAILERQGIQNLQPLTVRLLEAPQPGNCTRSATQEELDTWGLYSRAGE